MKGKKDASARVDRIPKMTSLVSSHMTCSCKRKGSGSSSEEDCIKHCSFQVVSKMFGLKCLGGSPMLSITKSLQVCMQYEKRDPRMIRRLGFRYCHGSASTIRRLLDDYCPGGL